MSKPLLVGISGGIGAGKSIISKIFGALDVPTYDADSRAKELMTESESLKSAIAVLFGDESYLEGELNRKHIASKAFYDPKLLNQLNLLVHPAVQEDFVKWVETQEAPYVLKEAALLFESGSHKSLDKVILVTAPESVRVSRVLNRDNHRSEKDVKVIISRQMSDQDKEKLADIIISNDGTQMILPKVIHLHKEFSKGC